MKGSTNQLINQFAFEMKSKDSSEIFAWTDDDTVKLMKLVSECCDNERSGDFILCEKDVSLLKEIVITAENMSNKGSVLYAKIKELSVFN